MTPLGEESIKNFVECVKQETPLKSFDQNNVTMDQVQMIKDSKCFAKCLTMKENVMDNTGKFSLVGHMANKTNQGITEQLKQCANSTSYPTELCARAKEFVVCVDKATSH